LRDGDPSVKKDWLPPDEVLRRIHNDGDETWLDYLVTSSFASFAATLNAWDKALSPTMRWLSGGEFPTVSITATGASGAAIAAGGCTSTSVTFKLALSGKSLDFDVTDVVHTGCLRARFLGMKTTYYLQCEYSAGRTVSVSVTANSFTVTNRKGANTPSEVFQVDMV